MSQPVYAKKRKQFELPPPGPVMATLIEIKDLGMVETEHGEKEKVLFTWETDLLDSDGAPMRVYERFNNSTWKTSRLASRIEDLTGALPDPDQNYNLSKLEGTRATLLIKHAKTDKGTFPNVNGVVREGAQKQAVPPSDEEDPFLS